MTKLSLFPGGQFYIAREYDDMFLKNYEINGGSSVFEIVTNDYRAAEVFRRYGISYCCGAKWPLAVVCENHGLDIEKIKAELESATRTILFPNQIDVGSWDIDFLIDYIIHVHHGYLERTWLFSKQLLDEFKNEHIKKFPYLEELQKQFELLTTQLLLDIKREEADLFPYIRQIAHALKSKETYAVLLVRTLRKPVEQSKSHEIVSNLLFSIRDITNNYTAPVNACGSHKVVFSRLKELDNDTMQHFHLERSILFPRVKAIENEVLQVGG
ncbi:MAG TPA: DUF542 domain-containing protein [Chitinophagaceae bacterium]|nr:DUF542 domain-containing protein [Chitinophagaceae bacterium]